MDYQAANDNGFVVANFRIGYKPSNKIMFNLILDNAFNQEYSLRPALLESPRAFAVQAIWDIQ